MKLVVNSSSEAKGNILQLLNGVIIFRWSLYAFLLVLNIRGYPVYFLMYLHRTSAVNSQNLAVNIYHCSLFKVGYESPSEKMQKQMLFIWWADLLQWATCVIFHYDLCHLCLAANSYNSSLCEVGCWLCEADCMKLAVDH